MDNHNSQRQALESDLLRLITANKLDLSLGGRVVVEKMNSSQVDDEARLSYFICSQHQIQKADVEHNSSVSVTDKGESEESEHDSDLSHRFIDRGVISGQLHFAIIEGELQIDAELSIKKFITPKLSLSSAHVAVLIHQVKNSLSNYIKKFNLYLSLRICI